MTPRAALELFTMSCMNLGVQVHGRSRVADPAAALSGFTRLTVQFPDQCDGWRGLAAAGEPTGEVIENAYRTLNTCGDLLGDSDVAADALDFRFDSGLYMTLPATGTRGIALACAATRIADSRFADALELLDPPLLAAQPAWGNWVLAVLHLKAQRWHDARQVLGPWLDRADLGSYERQAIAVAYGTAGAMLGLWEPSLELLERRARGDMATATAYGLLQAAMCARKLERSDQATALLNEAYGVPGVDEQTKGLISQAFSDPTYAIIPTTPARIDARTDYWDPATEPGEREHTRALGAERRDKLKQEAADALDGFVGMVDVKEEIARLGSSARADKRRAAKGLPVNNRSLHLVLKGPPGVGKTTVARVIGKLLCAADVLPTETFVEAGRGDLLDKVIGGSEQKILAIMRGIIESGGGVLFIDEAYTLTDSGSKNDFGPLVIGELIRYMVDYADRLMVIVAGYADKMDEFLDSNEGLRSRFGREIELPSYSVDELVEITQRAAIKRGSIVADPTTLGEVYRHLASTVATDTTGRERSALDVAGNGRFANTLLERAEEERDRRLDDAELLDDPDAPDEVLQTITAHDVQAAATRLLRKEKIAATWPGAAQ